jgi:hypothetical protein
MCFSESIHIYKGEGERVRRDRLGRKRVMRFNIWISVLGFEQCKSDAKILGINRSIFSLKVGKEKNMSRL